MKDLKYLSAYIVPFFSWISLNNHGLMSWLAVFVIFGAIPILEYFLPQDEKPYSETEINQRKYSIFFDLLLYLNVIIVYFILYTLIDTITTNEFDLFTVIGWIFSAGITFGSNGINVAHELGHRRKSYEIFLAKILLLPNFYLHFYIEHNKGHHRYVSTPKDPATARFNENLYTFWFRSIKDSYLSAWRIQNTELKKKKLPFFHFKNQMLLFQVSQISYLAILLILTQSLFFTLIVASAGLVGILLLETINYIEHYGLVRKQLAPNRWEKVQPWHSWNANYEVGRILLYELTRHSDHHYQAQKPYQLLEHHPKSPQLPLGYPGSMVLATIPPLWFKIMNPRIPTA